MCNSAYVAAYVQAQTLEDDIAGALTLREWGAQADLRLKYAARIPPDDEEIADLRRTLALALALRLNEKHLATLKAARGAMPGGRKEVP